MTEKPAFQQPTAAQELLLKACLRPGREAVACWEAWRTQIDIDQIDVGSRRLLPLLHAALAVAGIDHPLMGKYRGMWRLAWCRNQILMRDGLALAAALRQAGIMPMALKGAALNLAYYHDIGLRPMIDFDLMVPTGQALEAATAMTRLGWIHTPAHVPTMPDLLLIMHARPFENAQGNEVDLHWHVLHERCAPDADDEFWKSAIPAGARPVLLPDPADLLLMICTQGVRWNPASQLQWIADAVTVMRSGRMTWDRLLEQSVRCRMVLPLRQALRYVREVIGEAMPAEVVRALEAMPVAPVDAKAYRTAVAPVFGLAANWRFHRQCCARAFGGGLRGYLRYVRAIRPDIPPWSLPFWGVSYVARKLFPAILDRAQMPAPSARKLAGAQRGRVSWARGSFIRPHHSTRTVPR